MAPSQCRPKPSSVRSIWSAQPGITRGASRSSIRRSQRPPRLRASRKLPTAATREPRCSDPVGEGAKRPTYPELAAPARPRSSRALAIAVVAIAVLALASFPALLGFNAQGSHGACFQALDADFLAGFEAVAVRAILDALQRVVDLADQLAFPVTRAQLEAELLFLGGAVVGVGEVCRLVLHVRDRTIHFHHEVALPAVEYQAEVLELLLAHVLFAALGDVRLYVARTGEQAPRLDRLAVVTIGIHCVRRRGAVRGDHGRGGRRCGGRCRDAQRLSHLDRRRASGGGQG